MKAMPVMLSLALVPLVLLVSLVALAEGEALRFSGMPEGVSSGRRPDFALEGGGLNDRDSGNALRDASGGASAPPAGGPQPFDAHDLDADGFVSKAEAAGHAGLVGGFDRADRSRDGRLSKAEYARYEKRAKSRRAKRSKPK